MTSKRADQRQLVDAAGHPVIGYVTRKTRVADPWVARKVRYFRPAKYRRTTTTASSVERRSSSAKAIVGTLRGRSS